MKETHTFLCSIVVVDQHDQILFEDTILLASTASSEEEAKAIVARKLDHVESVCNLELKRKMFLSVHCPFFMPSFYSIDDFSKETLFESFRYLATIQIKHPVKVKIKA
jgi:hypothetical protein